MFEPQHDGGISSRTFNAHHYIKENYGTMSFEDVANDVIPFLEDEIDAEQANTKQLVQENVGVFIGVKDAITHIYAEDRDLFSGEVMKSAGAVFDAVERSCEHTLTAAFDATKEILRVRRVQDVAARIRGIVEIPDIIFSICNICGGNDKTGKKRREAGETTTQQQEEGAEGTTTTTPKNALIVKSAKATLTSRDYGAAVRAFRKGVVFVVNSLSRQRNATTTSANGDGEHEESKNDDEDAEDEQQQNGEEKRNSGSAVLPASIRSFSPTSASTATPTATTAKATSKSEKQQQQQQQLSSTTVTFLHLLSVRLREAGNLLLDTISSDLSAIDPNSFIAVEELMSMQVGVVAGLEVLGIALAITTSLDGLKRSTATNHMNKQAAATTQLYQQQQQQQGTHKMHPFESYLSNLETYQWQRIRGAILDVVEQENNRRRNRRHQQRNPKQEKHPQHHTHFEEREEAQAAAATSGQRGGEEGNTQDAYEMSVKFPKSFIYRQGPLRLSTSKHHHTSSPDDQLQDDNKRIGDEEAEEEKGEDDGQKGKHSNCPLWMKSPEAIIDTLNSIGFSQEPREHEKQKKDRNTGANRVDSGNSGGGNYFGFCVGGVPINSILRRSPTEPTFPPPAAFPLFCHSLTICTDTLSALARGAGATLNATLEASLRAEEQACEMLTTTALVRVVNPQVEDAEYDDEIQEECDHVVTTEMPGAAAAGNVPPSSIRKVILWHPTSSPPSLSLGNERRTSNNGDNNKAAAAATTVLHFVQRVVTQLSRQEQSGGKGRGGANNSTTSPEASSPIVSSASYSSTASLLLDHVLPASLQSLPSDAHPIPDTLSEMMTRAICTVGQLCVNIFTSTINADVAMTFVPHVSSWLLDAMAPGSATRTTTTTTNPKTTALPTNTTITTGSACRVPPEVAAEKLLTEMIDHWAAFLSFAHSAFGDLCRVLRSVVADNQCSDKTPGKNAEVNGVVEGGCGDVDDQRKRFMQRHTNFSLAFKEPTAAMHNVYRSLAETYYGGIKKICAAYIICVGGETRLHLASAHFLFHRMARSHVSTHFPMLVRDTLVLAVEASIPFLLRPLLSHLTTPSCSAASTSTSVIISEEEEEEDHFLFKHEKILENTLVSLLALSIDVRQQEQQQQQQLNLSNANNDDDDADDRAGEQELEREDEEEEGEEQDNNVDEEDEEEAQDAIRRMADALCIADTVAPFLSYDVLTEHLWSRSVLLQRNNNNNNSSSSNRKSRGGNEEAPHSVRKRIDAFVEDLSVVEDITTLALERLAAAYLSPYKRRLSREIDRNGFGSSSNNPSNHFSTSKGSMINWLRPSSSSSSSSAIHSASSWYSHVSANDLPVAWEGLGGFLGFEVRPYLTQALEVIALAVDQVSQLSQPGMTAACVHQLLSHILFVFLGHMKSAMLNSCSLPSFALGTTTTTPIGNDEAKRASVGTSVDTRLYLLDLEATFLTEVCAVCSFGDSKKEVGSGDATGAFAVLSQSLRTLRRHSLPPGETTNRRATSEHQIQQQRFSCWQQLRDAIIAASLQHASCLLRTLQLHAAGVDLREFSWGKEVPSTPSVAVATTTTTMTIPAPTTTTQNRREDHELNNPQEKKPPIAISQHSFLPVPTDNETAISAAAMTMTTQQQRSKDTTAAKVLLARQKQQEKLQQQVLVSGEHASSSVSLPANVEATSREQKGKKAEKKSKTKLRDDPTTSTQTKRKQERAKPNKGSQSQQSVPASAGPASKRFQRKVQI